MARYKQPEKSKGRGMPVVMERWLAWCFHDYGVKVSPAKSYAFWYRDKVLFGSNVPIARMLFNDRDEFLIVLSSQSTRRWYASSTLIKTFGKERGPELLIDADNLGVWGVMGAMMPDEAFIDTLFPQLEDYALWLIELATTTTPSGAKDVLTRHRVKKDDYFDYRVSRINATVKQYEQLARFSGRDRPVPQWMLEAEDTVLARLRKMRADYDLPERVARRERAQAIKEAKLALTQEAA